MSMHDTPMYDVLIIGAGPIGLACGISANEHNLSNIILEKGCLANSLYNYPVNMTFFSSAEKLEIGGMPFTSINPKPNRSEALEYYRKIDQKFSLNTHFFEEVTAVSRLENCFEVTSKKNLYRAKFVIIATGFYDLPMLLKIPGEHLKKVSHYYKDPHYYSKQKVVVVGASNSSIDAALEIYRKGGNVTLVIRGSEIGATVKYWVRPDIENRINLGEIKVYYNSNLTEITEKHVKIRTENGDIQLENDFVLALTGYHPNFSFLKNAGINIPTEYPHIPEHNDETLETNIDNLYLAGVVCGGLNTHLWFIENSRIHADSIMKDIINKLASV